MADIVEIVMISKAYADRVWHLSYIGEMEGCLGSSPFLSKLLITLGATELNMLSLWTLDSKSLKLQKNSRLEIQPKVKPLSYLFFSFLKNKNIYGFIFIENFLLPSLWGMI